MVLKYLWVFQCFFLRGRKQEVQWSYSFIITGERKQPWKTHCVESNVSMCSIWLLFPIGILDSLVFKFSSSVFTTQLDSIFLDSLFFSCPLCYISCSYRFQSFIWFMWFLLSKVYKELYLKHARRKMNDGQEQPCN